MDKEKIEQLGRLGEALERICKFTEDSRRYGSEGAWFSREYVLKHLLGMTDEEYELNEKLLNDMAAKRLAKQKKIESLTKIKMAEEDFTVDAACDYAESSNVRAVQPKFLKSESNW